MTVYGGSLSRDLFRGAGPHHVMNERFNLAGRLQDMEMSKRSSSRQHAVAHAAI